MVKLSKSDIGPGKHDYPNNRLLNNTSSACMKTLIPLGSGVLGDCLLGATFMIEGKIGP